MTRHQVWKARERARFLFIATQARGQKLHREQGLTRDVLAIRSLANHYAGECQKADIALRRRDGLKANKRAWWVFLG